MNFKTARESRELTLESVSELSGFAKGTISDLENHGCGSDRLRAKLLEIYGLTNTPGIRQYPKLQPPAMSLHDAPREYLVDDALAEVQTIKEALAALERKLKNLNHENHPCPVVPRR